MEVDYSLSILIFNGQVIKKSVSILVEILSFFGRYFVFLVHLSLRSSL